MEQKPDRGPELVTVAVVFTVLSLFALALRCYTQAVLTRRFQIADYVAVLTGINQAGFCACVVLGVKYGLGKSVDVVSRDDRIRALIFKWAGSLSYVIGSTLIKIAAGLLLLPLFSSPNHKWQRITIIALMVLVGIVQTGYLFIGIFQCIPIPFYWYRYTPDAPVTGSCHKPLVATIPTYISILVGVISDWTLALLPFTLVWNAQMDRRTKISVVAILGVGSMASIANVARIPYARQLLSNPDYLANFTDLAIWSIIECGLGLLATSLATLRPLFLRLKVFTTDRLLSEFMSSRSRTAQRKGATELSDFEPQSGRSHGRSRRGTVGNAAPHAGLQQPPRKVVEPDLYPLDGFDDESQKSPLPMQVVSRPEGDQRDEENIPATPLTTEHGRARSWGPLERSLPALPLEENLKRG